MLTWWLPGCNETFHFDLSKMIKAMNIPFKVTGKGQIAEHILESSDNTPTNKKVLTAFMGLIVYSKGNYIYRGGGPKFSRLSKVFPRVHLQLLIPKETYNTCDLSTGVGEGVRNHCPLDPRMLS